MSCSTANRTACAWLICGVNQKNEIEQAHLQPGEDEALETEKRVLANAEKLYAAAMGAFDQLYESGSSAEAALRSAERNVEELARYDPGFRDAVQQLCPRSAPRFPMLLYAARLRGAHQRLARAAGRD